MVQSAHEALDVRKQVEPSEVVGVVEAAGEQERAPPKVAKEGGQGG